jgi:hypothetical protein
MPSTTNRSHEPLWTVRTPRATQAVIFLRWVLQHATFGIAPILSIQRGVITHTANFLANISRRATKSHLQKKPPTNALILYLSGKDKAVSSQTQMRNTFSRPIRFPKWLCIMTVINAFPIVDIDRGSSRRRLQSPLLDGLDEIKS